MSKKYITQIIVIVIGFIGAGLVLYYGLFKKSSQLPLAAPTQTVAQAPQEILPYGSVLDFSILKNLNLYYNQLAYPKLESRSDFGIPEETLISPAAK